MRYFPIRKRGLVTTNSVMPVLTRTSVPVAVAVVTAEAVSAVSATSEIWATFSVRSSAAVSAAEGRETRTHQGVETMQQVLSIFRLKRRQRVAKRP